MNDTEKKLLINFSRNLEDSRKRLKQLREDYLSEYTSLSISQSFATSLVQEYRDDLDEEILSKYNSYWVQELLRAKDDSESQILPELIKSCLSIVQWCYDRGKHEGREASAIFRELLQRIDPDLELKFSRENVI